MINGQPTHPTKLMDTKESSEAENQIDKPDTLVLVEYVDEEEKNEQGLIESLIVQRLEG